MGLRTNLPIEILDYVRTHDSAGEGGYGIGQSELAKALGYHPCSMSRPLETLVRTGQLVVQRAPVRDAVRKRLTYHLTPGGVSRLRRETSGVPLISGEVPSPPQPFLGRRQEVERLLTIAGEGASVTIIDGAAGMGKTSLVSRFLRRSGQSQGRLPFWYTLRPASSPRQFVDALARALSTLGKPQLAYYAQLPRNPLPRECADLASRALEDKTLSAVIDDFHLAGTDLRAFIAEFVVALGARGGHQFYLVGQGAIEAPPSELPVHRMTIEGLDRASAHDLTDRQGGLGDRFEEIYKSTLGSPLLLKLAVFRPEAAVGSVDLPAAVIARLGSTELKAILPVAVSNEPLPLSFLLEDRALTEERLKGLARSGILQPALRDRYEMLQAIRAAVRAKIDSESEQGAHRRLARYYARSHRPEPLRERFFHLVHGGECKSAADVLDTHQREIFRLGYSDALRNAIGTLLAGLPSGASKVRTLHAEATLLRQHSEYAEAIRSLQRAVALTPEGDRLRSEALLRIVDLHLKLGDLHTAEREFLRARRVRGSSRRLEAFVSLTEARLAEGRGHWKMAAVEYQRAFEAARHAHASDLALESIASWSKFAEQTSGPEVALRLIREALPSARQSGNMDVVFNLRLARARAYSDMGRQEAAEQEIVGVRSEAEALGYLTQLTYALSGLASVATERKQWTACVSYAKQASELAGRLGANLVLGHTLATLCSAELQQADLEGSQWLLQEALEHGERAVEVLERIAPTDSLVFAHGYLVQVYLAMKQHPQAISHYERSIAIADSLGLKALSNTMRKELRGRVAEARRAMAKGNRPSSPEATDALRTAGS